MKKSFNADKKLAKITNTKKEKEKKKRIKEDTQQDFQKNMSDDEDIVHDLSGGDNDDMQNSDAEIGKSSSDNL